MYQQQYISHLADWILMKLYIYESTDACLIIYVDSQSIIIFIHIYYMTYVLYFTHHV